jgi:hypothetical protein
MLAGGGRHEALERSGLPRAEAEPHFSVRNRMVGTFPIIFLKKTLGFPIMPFVLLLRNPERLMTPRTKGKERHPQLVETKRGWLPGQDSNLEHFG